MRNQFPNWNEMQEMVKFYWEIKTVKHLEVVNEVLVEAIVMWVLKRIK
jgi:hypothetical protein